MIRAVCDTDLPAVAQIKLHLLGQFRVSVAGQDLDLSRLPRKNARLVLKLLALAPGGKLHREQILEALAPEADPESGLNRLHKAIHMARRALEPNLDRVAQSRFLLTQDTLVLLAPTLVETDVADFERAATEALRNGSPAALEQAVAQYTGDLLEEDLHEDWAAAPRERLRLTNQRLLSALSAAYETAGDLRTIEAVQCLLAAFPSDEEGHRRLMRFYAAMGQRHLALEHFRQCTEALAQNLDAQPEKATVELYQTILDGNYPVSKAPAVTENATPEPKDDTPPPPQPPKSRFLRVAAGIAAGIALAGLWLGLRTWESPKPIALAILPLHTASADPDSGAIADGLTEGLINSASRLPRLKVMARTTAFSFKNRTDCLQVGRELKVSHVVCGLVEKQEGAMNVNLELVDVSDGSQVWGRKYAVSLQDTPVMQQRISAELAAALKVSPVKGLQQERTTSNPEAYRLYLTGRQYWNQRSLAGLKKSIEVYRQAIDLDPNYGLAWAGLADGYGLIGFHNGLPQDYYPRAKEAAERALKLDPTLAEAQTSLAMVNALYTWDWAAAERDFRRAIEMNPGYATAHHWLAVHLSAMGRFDEARKEFEKALSLDPRSAIVTLNSGYPELYQRKYDTAMTVFKYALTINPNFPPAHDDLVTVYAAQKNTREATREWLNWLRTEGPEGLAARLEPAAARGDYPAVFRESTREFETSREGEYTSPMLPALAALWLGEKDRAFHWLNVALEQRCPQLVYIGADPRYDSLRADPRFQDLLTRIGLPVR
jgi:DNA-binding SARP family transcriptional activator/TolB-like protein